MKVRLVVLVLAIAGAVGGALAQRAPAHASVAPAVVVPGAPSVGSQVDGGGWWDWDRANGG
jgi:hypothetical protein